MVFFSSPNVFLTATVCPNTTTTGTRVCVSLLFHHTRAETDAYLSLRLSAAEEEKPG